MTSKNIDRIKIITETEKVSIRQMEIAIGCSNGVLSRAIKNGTDIQGIWLSKIIETYPKYNAEWLLTGKGTILKQECEAPVLKQESNFNCSLCIEKERIISVLESQLSNSIKDIDRLLLIIKDLTQNTKEEHSRKRTSA